MSTRSRETKGENNLKQPQRDPNLQRRMQDVILARLNLKAVPGILAQSSDGAEPTSHATDLTNFKLHSLRCRSMTDTPRARSFAVQQWAYSSRQLASQQFCVPASRRIVRRPHIAVKRWTEAVMVVTSNCYPSSRHSYSSRSHYLHAHSLEQNWK
jgi:hypothetical protein